MRYSFQNLNASAAAMNGYRDSQGSRNGALGVIRRIGTNSSGNKVGREGGQNENRSYLLPGKHR
jgi:hypothetical protein